MKNIKKYKIQVNGKLPTSYVYEKEPELPKNVHSSRKNICFVGWWYQARTKKFQTGVTRTWYNARVSQFSKGLKGNITVFDDSITRIKMKKLKKGKTYYVQYRRIPFAYGGVALETFWGEKYKIKVK